MQIHKPTPNFSKLTSMDSQNAKSRTPMYPEIINQPSAPILSNPNQSSSLYPTVDPYHCQDYQIAPEQPLYHPSAPPEPFDELIFEFPGVILHLIDKQYSVNLASGDLSVICLRQGSNLVTVLACVSDMIQWPLTKDVAAVKLDDSHYFFSFEFPGEEDMILNYGLTIASKGQNNLLKNLDSVLETYTNFSIRKAEVRNGEMVTEFSISDLKSKKKRDLMENSCRAYWTTLAPNVEDYSGNAAKMIAAGSGQLIKGILWCGDVTVDRLNWGNEVLTKKMNPGSDAEISPETLKRIKRVKKVTKMTEKVAKGVLSGVVKVSGFVSSSVANSKAGKKFFGLIPGEVVIASVDGINKVCDAVEVAGKNVMSTSATVTTGLVSHKYGEEAAKATNEGLDAAGHAIGTAWTVLKFRKALNPKSMFKPSALGKSAASELKSKKPK